MKKILILVTHFYPFRGGLESHALNLAKGLTNKGYEVHVASFNSGKDKPYEIYQGINIHRLDCKPLFGDVWVMPSWKGFKQLLKLKKERFDVINTHTRFFFSSWLGALISALWRIPLLHIEHGNSFVQHPSKLVAAVSWICDHTINRLVFKQAKVTIGVSNRCETFARKMGAKNVCMVPNSINLKDFPKRKKQPLNKVPIIIYLGRLIKAKGLYDLDRALRGYPCKLWIIGSGPAGEDLKGLYKGHNIDAKFFGSMALEDYKGLFSKADIFINPSYSEGLPTSVLEAGAMGVPVIATNVGGTPQIMEDTHSGYLVNPHEPSEIRYCIELLQNNPHIKTAISDRLYRDINVNFNWSRNIDRVIRILETIL